MSCNYADGLSPYDNKGTLGLAEKFDSSDEVRKKCSILAKLIKEAKHVVVHTGAGISTAAGIPDFRGPKGVWTLEEKGLKPTTDISFKDAKPTKTHMALKHMAANNLIHYVVSQNIDGLHLKSGLSRSYLAELHGNMFTEQCNVCNRQSVRKSPAHTVGKKLLGQQCYGARSSGRPCRGKLQDTILDWEHSLPDDDLNMSEMHSSIADLSICLGTTLQIIPSGNLPLDTLRYRGKLVICNLQPTKHDNKADLIINTYVDDVMVHLMDNLGFGIPEYDAALDPTSNAGEGLIDWTITQKLIKQTKTLFNSKCNGVTKIRALVKKQRDLPTKVEVLPCKRSKNDMGVDDNKILPIKCDVKNILSEDSKTNVIEKLESGVKDEIKEEITVNDDVQEIKKPIDLTPDSIKIVADEKSILVENNIELKNTIVW